ncbi:uncharacterized protein A4U43_C05F29380 [Asparagus officinalis]|uniref:ENTH domain-containing protein n=1 Tax=Asparagus officinalis TaxID=4686 RepID=A0A5P1EXU3_ASPOF|nr:uncharacterized protein A4U43_C05F29380 [Asparagus officinalis]
MDFMKVLDQTVREIKREVNLKVLKVPELEQKALTVIEYLMANGSKQALDNILERSFQISSLSGFEYVDPNGKDVGINVRKKVETIVGLINDKEKIQAVRKKAAATRDKYVGLSSSGVTYKSSASSYGGSSRYGGFDSSRDGESFNDSYKDKHKSIDDRSNENESGFKKGGSRHSGSHASTSSKPTKTATKMGADLSSKSASIQPNDSEDDFGDFDDFDPRGSTTGGSANTTSIQVNPFGESLVGDLMDTPTSPPTEPAYFSNKTAPEVDLFADATFVLASPHEELTTGSHDKANIDLFANQPAFPAPPSASVDLFRASDSGSLSEAKYSSSEQKSTAPFDPFPAPDSGMSFGKKSSNSEHINTTFDPFAAIPLNSFEETDSFSAFTSHSESKTTKPQQKVTNNSLDSMEQSMTSSKPEAKKDAFQVKSGIWADSLSRGLIDLNITAPKTINLAANIGVVGGLGDASDATPWYMTRPMVTGSSMGMSGFPSSTSNKGDSGFSTSVQQQYGGFK